MNTAARAGIALLVLAGSLCSAAVWAQPGPDAVADTPRAYGYTVGDVVQRRVRLQLPPGWALDLDALPRTRRPGQALELRSARLEGAVLLLDYQVFLAPTEVRTLELPPVLLQFNGPAGAREVRVDAWPLTVAPLMPTDVSPREGLGAMRPDVPAPLIDITPRQHRLLAAAALLLLLGLALTQLHLGLPWWRSRQRPFAQAWRALKSQPDQASPEQAQAAMKLLHAAFNRSAGQVLFAAGVPAFVAAQPRFAPLQPALAEFFDRSRASFFTATASTDTGTVDIAWLKRLARAALDAERGAR
jgi:mxaA protein